MPTPSAIRRSAAFAALLLTLLVGCAPEDGIRTHEVPKPEPEVIEAKVRLLAVVLPKDPDMWFVKLSGPKERVDAQEAKFLALVSSLAITGKKDEPLTWKLPDGWEFERGKGAELQAEFYPEGKTGKLRLTVNRFGKMSTVLENVVRWCRTDLGRKAVRESDLDKYTRPVKMSGLPATLVDMVGPGPQPGHGGMGGMGKGGPKIDPTRPVKAGKLPVTYKAPEGWTETGPRQFMDLRVITSFTLAADGKTAKVDLTAQDGGLKGTLLSNVNRWRGMVGLPEMTEAQFSLDGPKAVTLGGKAAKVIDMAGPEARQIVVVLEEPGRAWYVKILGDGVVVARNKAAFDSFVASIRFTGGSE